MDKILAQKLISEINNMVTEEIKIMEVCGTHTQAISKLGLRTVLSPKIKLISGPGCPVCVTEEGYIDRAISMLNHYKVTLVTFGDLMRVKGSEGNLLEERGKGRDVRVIYSPMDLIEMAQNNRDKNIVFLGVGFETTAPVIALAIKTAWEKGISNLFFLTSLKLMEPILRYIFTLQGNKIDGLICPGHVASVKGSIYFRFIAEEYGIPSCVCGFEALDILGGVYYLVKNITAKENKAFKNLYRRCVRDEGNPAAIKLLEEVFKVFEGTWRGIGGVDKSSLIINEKYSCFDAHYKFPVEIKAGKSTGVCECSEILLGRKTPDECRLFDKICSPQRPCGPCMVSTEGACSIAYRYRGGC